MVGPPRMTYGRDLALSGLALTFLFGSGTVGYVMIEGWSPLDALFMAFITLTTIGFNEVHPLSPSGKIFTIALASVGIGTFAFIATRTVQMLVENNTFRQRIMQRRIDRLEQHYVVVGYGRIGQRIARDLRNAGKQVVVIDRRDDRALELDADGFLFVHDMAEEENTLRLAGLEKAAGLVLVLPSDAANVFVALSAREIRGKDLFIVSRTNEPGSARKLLRAGADKVISPLEIGADRIAQTILRPRVDRFMDQVLGVKTLDLHLEEVVVERGSPLDKQSLEGIDFRQRFQATVVAVLREGDGTWEFNPDSSQKLAAGDAMIVLTSTDQLQRITEECARPTGGIRA